MAKTASSTTVTGTATKFLEELGIGDEISVPGGGDERRIIITIASDTSLEVGIPFEFTASGETATAFPAMARFANPGNVEQVVVTSSGGLAFLNTNDSVDGGIEISNGGDAGEKQLFFGSMADGNNLLDLGPRYGIQFGVGLRNSSVTFIDANETLTASSFLVYADAGSGGVTVTLPPVASQHNGRWYQIFKVGGSGDVTIAPDGSDSINGVNAAKTLSTTWSGAQLFGTEDLSGWVATELSPL